MNYDISMKLRQPTAQPDDDAADEARRGKSTPLGGKRRTMAALADVTTKSHGDAASLRRPHIRLEEVLSRQQFLRQVEREKRRADRTKLALSLVVFRLIDAADDHVPDRLIAHAGATKRETDFIGYLDDASVAVLLPDTGGQGAQRFVEKLGGDPSCTMAIETYPSQVFEFLKGEAEPPCSFEPLVDVASAPGGAGRVVKRTMDLAGGTAGLILLTPLLLIIALAIAIDSPGPVLYKQSRLGRGGKPFVFYKFRSMHRDADERVHREYVTSLIAKGERGAESQRPWSKLVGDARVTRVGQFLRKTCLDELPQLFNVVRGELSLVGPRPPLPYEAAAYEPWHLRRVLEVSPGITGLWQVSGGSAATFNDMVRMDLRYVRTWSLTLGLRILAKTFLLVLRRGGGG
jgi:lipopolysaccharide/colanic/teichoic acid biosynthesis glycosyltransferase